jgi:hypothetical protein
MATAHEPDFATPSTTSDPSPVPRAASDVDPRFLHGTYKIKRPWFSWFERTFRVFAPDGSLALFVRHPVMRLRGEWQIFGDEQRTDALLTVKSQQIIAFNLVYDLTDAKTGAHVGSVRSKGLRSLIRDEIEIFAPDGRLIGHLREKGASILRRFFPWLTSKHDIEIGGQIVATVRQKFRFFVKEFDVDQPVVALGDDVDPRLVLACALLAVLNEARRENN